MKPRANAFVPYRPEHTAADWYSSRRWKKRRARQLKAEPLCAICLAKGRVVPASVADHEPPWKPGPIQSSWNRFITGKLQSLCRECHEIKEGRLRPRVEIGEDGWPTIGGLSPAEPAD
jgi:hypothetical protein